MEPRDIASCVEYKTQTQIDEDIPFPAETEQSRKI